MSAYTLSGPKIVMEHGVVNRKNLTIVNQKIGAISDEKTVITKTFPEDWFFIPGMIDMHVHGSHGADTMDATAGALDTICQSLAKTGCTSFLATTMSERKDKISAALANIAQYKPTQAGAEILGAHLEGPFLSEKRKGAMKADCLIDPSIKIFDEWLRISQRKIKLVTIAPERRGAIEFIAYLIQNDIIASVGHTEASFDLTNDAIKAGATHATHLFNAMQGLHHRDPGTTGALLMSERVVAELIADTHHLHPAMLNLVYRLKGKKRCVLVTDAMRAQCLKNGEYDLGGQFVTVRDGMAHLSEHPEVLAGSVVTQIEAAKNMQAATQCTLNDIVTMTAETPAKSLNLFDRKGSVAVGKDADLVLIDQDFNIKMTLCRGEIVYKNLD